MLVFRAPEAPAAVCAELLAVSRAAWCARGRRPARKPSALRAFGSARRLEARPGPAAAHGHRSQALMPPTGPPPVIQNAQLASESPVIRGYAERYTFSTDFVIHFPPISVSRSLAAQPDAATLAGLVCPLEYVANRCPWALRPGPPTCGMPPRRCVGRALGRGVVLPAREGMQKVRSPRGSADLRGTPAEPEFAQWRSAFTRCLASASSLS